MHLLLGEQIPQQKAAIPHMPNHEAGKMKDDGHEKPKLAVKVKANRLKYRGENNEPIGSTSGGFPPLVE